MPRVICKQGSTSPGEVTVTLQRQLSEYHLSEEITATLLHRAESAAKNGAEVEILRFAA